MHKTCRFFALKSGSDKTKAGAFKASAFVLYLLSCRNFLDCGQQADGAFFLGDMGAIHNFFLPFWIAIVLLPIVYQIVGGGGKGISTKRALST